MNGVDRLVVADGAHGQHGKRAVAGREVHVRGQAHPVTGHHRLVEFYLHGLSHFSWSVGPVSLSPYLKASMGERCAPGCEWLALNVSIEWTTEDHTAVTECTRNRTEVLNLNLVDKADTQGAVSTSRPREVAPCG